jgi:hypothetical protein
MRPHTVFEKLAHAKVLTGGTRAYIKNLRASDSYSHFPLNMLILSIGINVPPPIKLESPDRLMIKESFVKL